MWWFFRQSKTTVLDGEVQESFSKVRQDTAALFQWIEYLHRNHLTHQETIKTLSSQNAVLHRLVAELKEQHEAHKNRIEDLHSKVEVPPHKIKAVIDEHVPVDKIHARIAEVEQKLATLGSKTVPLVSVQQPSQTGLQARVLRRVSRNSKEYVKSTLRSLVVKYGKISALELRDIVVEEQRLCSRSSFYRLLDEVEQEGSVLMEAQGKEKIYATRLSSINKEI